MTDTDRIQINEARIRAEFDELARIDSESFGEREMADRLKEKLAELGIQAKEDDTAEKIGGNAGNLFGTLKGGLSGTPILQAPTILSFEAAVKGRAAHAGFEPEKGIHAIQTAARAIAALKLGHVDEETTLNVGLISGGSVVNAVPELCTCRGEIRSYSHEKAMETLEDVRAVFETAVKEAGAELSFTHRLHVKAFHLEPVAPVAVHFAGACRTLGIEPKFGSTFGGSDGNTMMQHGIPCAVLSCGMYDVHSVREYAKVGDIVNGARLIAELITQGQEASIE